MSWPKRNIVLSVRRKCPSQRVSPWIERWAARIPRGGSVLDLACGDGRHARWLADRGHRVVGVDRDLDGVADLADDPRFEWLAHDLEAGGEWPLARRTFDGVVVTNYLWRPILAHVFDAVATDGVLLYETFAVGNERYGRPRNPDFLLAPGELLACRDRGLEVVAFEQGIDSEGGTTRVVERVVAVRAAGPQPIEPRAPGS
ncbi:MAG: class I SAM-dependent methyltransferase [Planctomycetes bacterium]|nr:class I SAM-dependent methyltransferase [Planctomycetota bacterium]